MHVGGGEAFGFGPLLFPRALLARGESSRGLAFWSCRAGGAPLGPAWTAARRAPPFLVILPPLLPFRPARSLTPGPFRTRGALRALPALGLLS